MGGARWLDLEEGTPVKAFALIGNRDVDDAVMPRENDSDLFGEVFRFSQAALDVGLPDGRGTDLLPLLKKNDGTVTPVVLFTASDVTQEVSATVAATLIKSRTSEAILVETIRQMIAQHPSTS